MANGPEEQLPDPPEAPPAVDDLSAFDDDEPLAGYTVGSDEDALRKMGKRTTTFGKISMILLVGGVIAAGFFAWRASLAHDSRMDTVEACGAMEEREPMLACLRAELGETDYDDVKDRIMRNLAHFEDAEAVPALIEQLENPGLVRRSAAMALAGLGLPAAESAKAPLLAVLPDTDEKDWAAVVWALTVLRESQASDHIIRAFSEGRLQEMEGFSPRLIQEVLGPSRLSSDELLNHEEEGVRMLTAQALAEVGSPDVVDPLSRLLAAEAARGDDASNEVLREAAAGLGRTGDPRAAQPLFELMNEHPNLRGGVIEALRKTTGAPALAVLVEQASEVTVKRDLVRLLAEAHDVRVSDNLAALMSHEDSDIKSTAAMALADLGDERSVETLLALAGGEDEGTADAALDSLQRLGSPQSADGLLVLLPPSCPDEPEPEMPAGCFRQAALLNALGAAGGDRAARRIEEALSGVDSPTAARSLARMNYEPAFERLLGMVERPSDIDMAATNAAERTIPNEDLLRARKGAILAMGRYGRPEASEALMTVVEDDNDDYELRSLSAASLGMCATAEIMQTVLTKIQDEAVAESARRYYVQALWQKPHRELNSALLDLIASDAATEIRRAAALAIGYAADPANDARLIEMLADDGTRREAAFAIVLGGSVEGATALMAVLTENTDTDEVLQYGLSNEQNDWFNQLTTSMFESGEVWRRLEVGLVLQVGTRSRRWGLPFMKAVTVLKSGWNGVDGVNARDARHRIYEALTGEDATRRRLAARVLAAMGERGLLIRARDEGEGGASEATDELDRLNRPQGSTD